MQRRRVVTAFIRGSSAEPQCVHTPANSHENFHIHVFIVYWRVAADEVVCGESRCRKRKRERVRRGGCDVVTCNRGWMGYVRTTRLVDKGRPCRGRNDLLGSRHGRRVIARSLVKAGVRCSLRCSLRRRVVVRASRVAVCVPTQGRKVRAEASHILAHSTSVKQKQKKTMGPLGPMIFRMGLIT